MLVEKKSVMWREKKFHVTYCHVEKFLQMKNVKKIYHIERVLHMINVEQNVLCGEMWRNRSCGDIFPHDRFLHMNNEKCGKYLSRGEISSLAH